MRQARFGRKDGRDGSDASGVQAVALGLGAGHSDDPSVSSYQPHTVDPLRIALGHVDLASRANPPSPGKQRLADPMTGSWH